MKHEENLIALAILAGLTVFAAVLLVRLLKKSMEEIE